MLSSSLMVTYCVALSFIHRLDMIVTMFYMFCLSCLGGISIGKYQRNTQNIVGSLKWYCRFVFFNIFHEYWLCWSGVGAFGPATDDPFWSVPQNYQFTVFGQSHEIYFPFLSWIWKHFGSVLEPHSPARWGNIKLYLIKYMFKFYGFYGGSARIKKMSKIYF